MLEQILGGDFNIFFNLTFEVDGGNKRMKNQSVIKFIHIKESLALCDIWRIRNKKKQQKNVIHLGTSISLVSLKEGKIIFWFQIIYKILVTKLTF